MIQNFLKILFVVGVLLGTFSCSNLLTPLSKSRVTGLGGSNESGSGGDGGGNSIVTSPYYYQLGKTLFEKWGTQKVPEFGDRCSSVTADLEGNVYCVGHTYGELFDTNPTNSSDILIFKISPKGELVWAKQVGESFGVPGGDTSQSDQCHSLAYYDGALYCAGSTGGSLEDMGSGACVVAKFKSLDGALSWVKQLDMNCGGLDVDSSGVYIGGETYGDFGETSGGSSDIVLVKLDHNKEDVWVKQLGAMTFPGGEASERDSCRDVSLDSKGGVYCGGITSGSLSETNTGGEDVFMAKFDTSGQLLWVSQLGADTFGEGSSGNDNCWSVVTNESGAFCGGRTTGDLVDTNTGGTDTLVSHFSTDGAISWVHQIGATWTYKVDETNSFPVGSLSGSGVCDELMLDPRGNVYCGGRSRSNLFDENAGNHDVIVFKLSPSGEFIWGKQWGVENAPMEASGYDTAYGMVFSGGQIYLGGETRSSLFDENAGNQDLILFTVEIKK